jgi:hypothetical protein
MSDASGRADMERKIVQRSIEDESSEGVLMAWAKERAQEGMTVDRQELLPPEGFLVLPRSPRWSVRCLLRPEQRCKEDEQGLREALCEQESVGVTLL